jgi:protein-disulfide isomerase
MYYAYKPILDKYLAQNSKDVVFVFKNWPLSSGCNAAVSGVHFSASCETSAAYLMAKQKGTGDALKDWMFMNQEKLSPATVKSAAADVGKIGDFDTQYAKTLQQVRTDAAIGTSLGINSTPSFFINGKRLQGGGVPPAYFDAIIDMELKKSK